MSTEPGVSVAASKDAAATSSAAALPAASERPKAGGSSVANTANQILFKNELYTSMKQKTMDQELMARFNKEAQEEEKRRFEAARAKVERLENKRKVLIGVGDMLGSPGSDPSDYSSASISVALAPHDTVHDVKKKLIAAACWSDELPSDFGLFDDVSEEPLKDGQAIEVALAPAKPPSAGKSASRRAGNAGAGGRAAPRCACRGRTSGSCGRQDSE